MKYVSEKTLNKIVNFVHHEQSKGYSDEQIKNSLEKKKWPNEVIIAAFGKLEEVKHKIPEKKVVKTKHEILDRLEEGYSKEEIRGDLEEKKFDEKVVNEGLVRTHQLEKEVKEAGTRNQG